MAYAYYFGFRLNRPRPPITIKEIPGLVVTLTYPTHLSFGKESYIDITLFNQGEHEISNVTVTVVFTNHLSIRTPLTQSNTSYFDSLKKYELKTQRIIFSLDETPQWFSKKAVNFYLLIMVGDGREVKLDLDNHPPLYIAPVPFSRLLSLLPTIATFLGLGNILANFLKEKLLMRR